MIYTSTDSLTILTKDLPLMKEFINATELGKLKIEAQGDKAVFIRKGLYYINDKKYGSLNVPHEQIEKYCLSNSISLAEFYMKLAGGKHFRFIDGQRIYSLSC